MGIRSLLRNAFGRSRTATAERDEPSLPQQNAGRTAGADGTEPVAGSAPAPEKEPAAVVPGPSAEPVTTPAPDTASASVPAPASEPAPAAAPASASVPAPASEPAPAEPFRAPVPAQPTTDRVPDPGPLGPTPGPTPKPDPLPQPEPGPTPMPSPKPIPEPDPVPAPLPSPPVEPEPTPRPVPRPEPAPGPTPEPQPAMPPRDAEAVGAVGTEKATGAEQAVGLEKVEKAAPALVSLCKTAAVSLEKQGLTGQRAAVYLVLDRSGSMREYYKNGTVQHLAEQALGLSANLDDDGTVPVVFFSTDVDGTADLDLTNYEGRIDELHGSMGHMGRTNYHWAMEAVIEHYRKSGATDPAFVIFQTDGGPYSKPAAERALCEAAKLPIFWQFVGFGDPEGKGFDFLRKLDDLAVPEKRVVDNAGFFHAGRDPRALTDARLYQELMVEFPEWLAEARAAGIVK
ncbi:vWA domain-containing protein [Streptomyces blastmyceticus]|uniref:VWFA domain-containing protein n=1 Tax=Streptomyces blastmyceticus TaxID=68180 RepID=A0ABN0WYV8_9ACTN